jgi:hypothetical protein
MLDGKAYKAHFPDDPAYDVASRVEAPRMPNSVELLAALAVTCATGPFALLRL